MEQKSVHKFIYKIESKQLKKSNWNLDMPLNVAMRNYPEIIVSLNDSQCLRFIDEINGVSDISEKVRAIQKKIRNIKKKPKSKENKNKISNYYDTLYNLQFQRDYVCVIMNSNKDYDRANKGFSINYGIVNGKECVINYRRFLGTNGGIKNSTIVYVNEDIYPELIEIGVDACRFFFNAKPDTHLEFDLGLAVREDSENPVYYVQYAHARICSILKMEEFIDNRIERLSTGQTQRANISRCLIHEPDIYIFDEPTLGLDIISSQAIIEFMKNEKERGKTIIYSTHYMEEAQYLCDRIVMMHQGQIIDQGSPEELMRKTETDNLRDTLQTIIKKREEIKASDEVQDDVETSEANNMEGENE